MIEFVIFCKCFVNKYLLKHAMKIKSILIHEYQHKSTRVNTNQQESDTNQQESDTNQHESTWINTNLTRINTSPTRVNTNQYESNTSQHKSTRVWHESTRVRLSQQESKTSLDHKKQNKYGSAKSKRNFSVVFSEEICGGLNLSMALVFFSTSSYTMKHCFFNKGI